MQMHEATKLREAYSVVEAQRALQEGWKLLTVVSAQSSPDGMHVPVYVLGRNTMRDVVMAAQGTALQPTEA